MIALECSGGDKDNREMVMINCDMGEAFGLYKMGDDEALMPLIDRRQRRLRLPWLRLQSHARDRAAGQASMASRSARIPRCPICRGSDAAR